jgi:hypothetical protein
MLELGPPSRARALYGAPSGFLESELFAHSASLDDDALSLDDVGVAPDFFDFSL